MDTIKDIETVMHLSKLKNQAYDKIMVQMYMEQYRQKLRNGTAPEEMMELYTRIEEFRAGKDVSNLWITVNPTEDPQSLYYLQEGIEQLKYKKYTSKLKYTFEQRGEEESTRGKGIHLHILLSLNSNCRMDSVKRSIHTIFDRYCGNPFHVNIKPCYDKWVDDKVKYLQGEKWDEDKDDKIQQDILFRQEKCLDACYNFER